MTGAPLILSVRVQPGSKKDEVVGYTDGVLRVRLKAPAVEGQANAALCAFLAEVFGTSKSRVELLKGTRGRDKRVAVTGAQRSLESVFPPGKTAPPNKKTGFLPGKT